MKLFYYMAASIWLSTAVQRLLLKIIIESGEDPNLPSGIKCSELYYRMKRSFNPGLRKIKSLEEMKEHYAGLKSFEAELKKWRKRIALSKKSY